MSFLQICEWTETDRHTELQTHRKFTLHPSVEVITWIKGSTLIPPVNRPRHSAWSVKYSGWGRGAGSEKVRQRHRATLILECLQDTFENAFCNYFDKTMILFFTCKFNHNIIEINRLSVLCCSRHSIGATPHTGSCSTTVASGALGMFSMFGRTGVPTKRGPRQKDKKFSERLASNCNSSVHCSTGPQQNVDDDYCACRPRQCRVKAVGGGLRGIHILGAPHFVLNRGPAWSKSGPDSCYFFLLK